MIVWCSVCGCIVVASTYLPELPASVCICFCVARRLSQVLILWDFAD